MPLHKKSNHRFIQLGICLVFGILALVTNGCIKKPKEEKKEIQYGDVLINGKNYLTVKIGAQWWMAENLTTNTYSNGQTIPAIEGADENGWANAQYGAKDNNSTYNYNWYAVVNDTFSIAPPGWHVPSDDDWKRLEQELGMDSEQANENGWRGDREAEKLKMANNKTWPDYDKNLVWGTNESGFAAQVSICRMFSGNTGDPGTAFFWTSSEGPGGTAYYRYLDYKKSTIFRNYGSKNYGFAVRLVLNN